MSELRIVSLISSATEIVHALGLGAFQVGRSHECDSPAEVLRLPVCSQPSFPVNGSSAEIDRLVKDRVASAASIYDIDSTLLASLQPTHIITQTQCKVCAVSLEDVERAMKEQFRIDARVVSCEPHSLADLWVDIRRIAYACAAPTAGEELILALQSRIQEIACRARQSEHRPRVAAIEWLEPLMSAGNWVPELIDLAGGVSVFGRAGQHSPYMDWSDLTSADPDIIVAMPCGFDLNRTRQEMVNLTRHPDWKSLRAVRDEEVYICDGNQFMNRPGPRLVESLQIFAEILHPGIFGPAFEGIGWSRFY